MRFCSVFILWTILLLGRGYGEEITFDRLIHAEQTPAEWLTYWGDYRANRFRQLNQINDTNVKSLHLEWMFQTNAPGEFETTPLVIDGVMYITTPDNAVYGIDARTGRQLWRYKYSVPKTSKYCCGGLNRGLAVLGNSLFYLTVDTRLLAIDRRDGTVIWNVNAALTAGGAYGGTEAPLVVKDKVIIGAAAGDYGIQGSIEAFDSATGKHL